MAQTNINKTPHIPIYKSQNPPPPENIPVFINTKKITLRTGATRKIETTYLNIFKVLVIILRV